MEAFLQGLLLTLGLIATIGAQNAMLIKQGLLRQHVFTVASLFFLCDIVLMSLGVYGLGLFLAKSPVASLILAVLGSLFLLVYGYRSAVSAYKGGASLNTDGSSPKQALGKVISLALALTLLNPHVYLDTVVIIGGIAVTLSEADKLHFLLGCLLSSGLWFYGVGFGSRLLVPCFRKPLMWRLLDGFTALIMWLIAYSMLAYAFDLMKQF
ncbi:amino acid transporter [Pasteurellaceae bacterium RH1A]|nr:amino acid transporter [Pasteurellaceae bacterium RH1A]